MFCRIALLILALAGVSAPAMAQTIVGGTCSGSSAAGPDTTGATVRCLSGTYYPVNGVSYSAGSGTAIDFNNGSNQYTTASCGAFTLANMVDGSTYTLAVKGTTSGTCSFTTSGITYRMPSNYGATVAGTMTLFSFVRVGTDVMVTWVTGS